MVDAKPYRIALHRENFYVGNAETPESIGKPFYVIDSGKFKKFTISPEYIENFVNAFKSCISNQNLIMHTYAEPDIRIRFFQKPVYQNGVLVKAGPKYISINNASGDSNKYNFLLFEPYWEMFIQDLESYIPKKHSAKKTSKAKALNTKEE